VVEVAYGAGLDFLSHFPGRGYLVADFIGRGF